MYKHFIFEPGVWIGEGKMNFSESSTTVRFYTRWEVEQNPYSDYPLEFECKHTVEMQGGNDHVYNKLTFFDIQKESFVVVLENELVGAIEGTGVIEEKKLAWEFRDPMHFEGFEVYELQENGDYLFHAEYLSQDNVRSVIEGRIWKKG